MNNRYPLESCCFATGHRRLFKELAPQIQSRIRDRVIKLIEEGVLHYYVGGAVGFDLLFACVIRDLRRIDPRITLHIFLPQGGSVGFSPEEQLVQNAVLRDADEVREIPVGDQLLPPPLVRDQALVEAGLHCICYLANDQLTARGGTSYTVRRAIEAARRIYLIWQPGDMVPEGEES